MSAATVEHEREWDERVGCLPVVRLSGQKERLADLADDELLEVAKAARRHASWAQARELAAIAELHRRRTDAESDDQLDHRFLSAHESVIEEVAVALTVTGNAAATLVHLADRLTGPLAATGAALEAGRIDLAKARVICDTTDGLPGQVADLVEAAALEKASDQTTGQLRRRIKRIAQRLAPESIEERKREAVRRRRMELWENPSGTADLALCDLAVEDAHAVYNKITAAALGLKAEGDPRPLSAIRADLALQLLHGTDLPEAIRAVLTQACTAPQSPAPDPVATAAAGATGVQVGGTEVGGVQGTGTESAGTESAGGQVTGGQVSGIEGSGAEVTGSGVTGAGIVRARAGSTGYAVRSASACLDDDDGGVDAAVASLAGVVGGLLADASERARPEDRRAAVGGAAQRIHHRLAEARDMACQGDQPSHGRPGYRPPAQVRREVEARHETCVFPTCNQPSHRCDLDHTVPWRPGITCRCNLAPLCRRHHRLKQRHDWKLFQIWPGLLIWVTPSGAWRIVRPDRQ
ncbi:DUF222 domain-containing protein [Actinomadura sp. NPDC000600]|uniref:HNH endonuclease signature motif containing protein n=1 Tax=Actinomadura sp. NPDC000600 TaxID=3154262 RepID=UPI003398CC07